jgi:type II secretory pathway pseudopilin PulG
MNNIKKIKEKEVEKDKTKLLGRTKSNKATSLIALIITIIVIIILSVIVIGATSNTSESANKAKFLADLSEIQQDVAIKRANNLIPTINNIDADINAGFTKVKIKTTTPGEFEDGWVVNLETINIKNPTLGNEYSLVVEDSEIIFGATAPDVYVYDTNGTVYYAKGFKEGNNIIYSQILIADSTVVEPENPNDWIFDSATGVITGYTGPDVETLIVPNSINKVAVTEIRGNNYKGIVLDKLIKNINISSGIEKIGISAFGESSNVQSITIPNTVTIIDDYAFLNCQVLTDITIPNSVTSIGSSAFQACKSLTSIVIPENIKGLNTRVFFNCPMLKNVTLPNSITSISSDAFNYCTSLENITLPNKLDYIGYCAFYSCTSLKNITIPNSVTEIYNNSFQSCPNLTLITLNMAENLVSGSKWGATNATIVWTGDPYVNFEDPSIWTFDKTTGIITKYFGPNLGTLIIPEYIDGTKVTEIRGINYKGILYDKNVLNVVVSDGISIIGEQAFNGSSILASVTLPDSVTTIGWEAFFACRKLTNITIPESVTTITGDTFAYCDILTEVPLPTTVTTFGGSVFRECPKIRNVIIPGGFSTIGSQTFYNCKALTSITIPSNITSINTSAFSGCSNLTYIKVKNAGPISGAPWGAINAVVDYDP